MKQYVLINSGDRCTLEDCPPGLFIFEGDVFFKTEYRTEKGDVEAYCESGEFFVGGTNSKEERDNLIVQPVESKLVDIE